MERRRVAVLSDVHYASAAEQERCDFCLRSIDSAVRRLAIRFYRYFIWQRDPFAHNHLLDEFMRRAADADFVVANGDYSCDSAFVGVSDDAACQSARECLGKVRHKFGENFQATMGDHELGKKPFGANVGGLRLASYHRAEKELRLEPFWEVHLGNYVLMGVASTLIALPVFESEALPNELPDWRELRAAHLERIARSFSALRPYQRLLLFCHDPTALPYLFQQDTVRKKLGQLEKTIIGHVHSNLYFRTSRILCGMPVITFLGHTPRRITSALRHARHWKPFNVVLCPALSGVELLKDGGYLALEIDPAGKEPLCLAMKPLPR
jgi:Calcineurin-like phosphoesterase